MILYYLAPWLLVFAALAICAGGVAWALRRNVDGLGRASGEVWIPVRSFVYWVGLLTLNALCTIVLLVQGGAENPIAQGVSVYAVPIFVVAGGLILVCGYPLLARRKIRVLPTLKGVVLVITNAAVVYVLLRYVLYAFSSGDSP